MVRLHGDVELARFRGPMANAFGPNRPKGGSNGWFSVELTTGGRPSAGSGG